MMSVDRLKEALENIHESRKDRYLSMFRKLESLGIPAYFFGDHFDEAVDKAVKVLKKNDRIVWFLRCYRIFCLNHCLMQMWREGEGEEEKELLQFFIDEYNARRKREGLLKINHRDFYEGLPTPSSLLSDIRHFLSLDIPEINDYIFTNQIPEEVIYFFLEVEKEWAESRGRQVDISLDYKEGAVDLIEFKDGWKWINLNRPSCRREAQAMGHCGNQQAGAQSTDTILSLREPLEKTIWRPHATFILKKNGTLGEMKGYANSKPDEKYHHYIVALLKLPIIKGLVGGGYLPENNFDLSDLNKNQYDEVIAANPGLSSGGGE
jgi:hypothetical protein